MFRSLLKHVPTFAGLLFVYAGIYKLLYPGEATMTLESLEVSYEVAKLIILAGIVVELYLGIILVFKIDLRYGLSAAMGLMFVFTVYVWYLSTLASPPSCGCLGLTGIFKSNKEAALFGVFRNVVLLWGLKLSYDFHFREPAVLEAKPA